jgi:putative addiction module component (TIGR02574 family)
MGIESKRLPRHSWSRTNSRASLSVVAHPVPNPPPGFDALSVDEKIEYVETLLARVLEGSPPSIPEWQIELLRERLADHQVDPTEGRPWADVRADLERKYVVSR